MNPHPESRASDGTRPSRARQLRRICATVSMAALTLTAGCAQFPGEAPNFSAAPSFTQPTASVIPDDPLYLGTGADDASTKPSEPEQTGPSEDDPCAVPLPPIAAACLDAPWGVAPLPQADAALVAERTSGRILAVVLGQEPTEVATISDLDTRAGGGLMSVAVSPTFDEDQLIYVYATTTRGGELIRIAQGDEPKTIMTGLPAGGEHTGGALLFDADGWLYLLTGSSEKPDRAAPPTADVESDAAADGAQEADAVPPLALLRVDGSGNPSRSNESGTAVFATGFTDPSGMCLLPNGTVGVVDHRAAGDLILVAQDDQDYLSPTSDDTLWTFTPGDGGAIDCVVADGDLMVTSRTKAQVMRIQMRPEGGFTGAPEVLVDEQFGALRAISVGPGEIVWFSSVTRGVLADTDPDGRGSIAVSPRDDDDLVVMLPPSEMDGLGGDGGGID